MNAPNSTPVISSTNSTINDASSHAFNDPASDTTNNTTSHTTSTAPHWLLPDGVNDVLFADADKQQQLRHRLIKQLQSHGYQLVAPPLIEFTESLLQEASEDLKRQTFKLIDQVTGRLMGVRADTTPQIRRIDAKFGQAYFGDAVARYCYAGHVIHTLPNGLFGSRTPLQLGAELFGCDNIKADFELLDVLYALIVDLQLPVSWHLDVGHVGVFKRLSELANLDDDTSDRLMQLYAKKALPELAKLCQSLPFGQDFYQLAIYGHDLGKLQAIFSDKVANDAVIAQCITELQTICEHLSAAKRQADASVSNVNLPNANVLNVSVDLTELSGYHYHTGLVFNLYINNESQAVARGGRFHGQVAKEQKTVCHAHSYRPAIGFSMDITRLLPYFSDDAESLASHWVWVDYQDMQQLNADQANQLAKAVAGLRQQGHRVIKPLVANDKPDNITHHLHYQQGQWVLGRVDNSSRNYA